MQKYWNKVKIILGDNMFCPDNIQKILGMLSGNGFEAYLVGGCVRNYLMGITPADYDITTNALPQDIKNVFSDCKTVDTGIKHGTVTVIADGMPVEITTYRTESKYSDNRRPDSVSFTDSLREDLKRRDFTVNAICYSPYTGYVDMFGGMEDIKKGILKTVGNPDARFNEDALRILRALRFSSKYGFVIDSEVKTSIINNAPLLNNIASERINAELVEILCGDKIFDILMDYFNVFKIIIPEIAPMYKFDQKNKYHKYDLWEHTCHVVKHIPAKKYLRLAALLHDIGKPSSFSVDSNGNGHFYGHAHISFEMTQAVMKRLKFDNKTADAVSLLVRYHDSDLLNEKAHLKRMMNRLGTDSFFDLLELKKADTLSQTDAVLYRLDTFASIRDAALGIISENECFSLKDLKVNGDDITSLGYSGRQVGEILNTLLNGVMSGELKNDKVCLLENIKKSL